MNNIKRDLKCFDAVITAAETRPLLKRIWEEAAKACGKEEMDKVKFRLLGDSLDGD